MNIIDPNNVDNTNGRININTNGNDNINPNVSEITNVTNVSDNIDVNNDPIVNDNINVVNIIDPSGNHQLMVTQIQLFYTTYGDPQNP